MSVPFVVTGAASGIGAAIANRLREQGEAVLSADIRDAGIIADLSHPAGRRSMAEEVRASATEGIRGIVACAGTAKLDDPALIVSTNYFGAVATLELLRPMLGKAGGRRALAIASIAATHDVDQATVDACLADDEDRARTCAVASPTNAYASSKRALALWLRRAATGADWAGAGISLNAIAPGTIRSPMTSALLATPEGHAMLSAVTPIATADFGHPDDIAEIATFLLTMRTDYLLGQMLFVDGGTDALGRPDRV